MAMTVRPDMVNGHRICHGGFIFTLADSTFAFACNSHRPRAVAPAVRDHLHPAGRAATAGRDRARSFAHRAFRDLRHPRRVSPDGVLPSFAAIPAPSAAPGCRRPRRRTSETADREDRVAHSLPISTGSSRSPRTGPLRARLARRDCGAADESASPGRCAHAYDNVAALQAGVRRRRRASRRFQATWPTSRNFRSRSRPTCATTIRSACSRCRASKLVAASMPPPAPPASRPWSAIPRPTSRPGPT